MMRPVRVLGRSGAVVFALWAAGCNEPAKPSAPTPKPGASTRVSTRAAPSSRPAPSASTPPRASAAPSPSDAAVEYAVDAGANACRLLYGPAQQPFTGELTLQPDATGVLVVTHHDGVPTLTRVVAPRDDKPVRTALDSVPPRVSSPPCAVAGTFSLCMDAAGAIHKRPLEAEGHDEVIAHARPGSSFDADVLESVHVVVAYLADGRTSEGVVTQAFAVVDREAPVRISDDGSGTTFVTIAPRGASVVALLLDGRVAMTPVHARTLGYAGGKLAVGEDAVVYVGGAAQPRTRATLGVSEKGAFALTGLDGESGFGMAAVHLDDPPRLDEPTTWSAYPNGLDPAPIAATEGLTPIRVARVRPLEAAATSPRVLELGKLDDKGVFTPYGLVPTQGKVKSVTMAGENGGTMWLAYTDGAGTWLERRACPGP
jgi:hypothetical protein